MGFSFISTPSPEVSAADITAEQFKDYCLITLGSPSSMAARLYLQPPEAQALLRALADHLAGRSAGQEAQGDTAVRDAADAAEARQWDELGADAKAVQG